MGFPQLRRPVPSVRYGADVVPSHQSTYHRSDTSHTGLLSHGELNKWTDFIMHMSLLQTYSPADETLMFIHMYVIPVATLHFALTDVQWRKKKISNVSYAWIKKYGAKLGIQIIK